jgi:hypothetical protein
MVGMYITRGGGGAVAADGSEHNQHRTRSSSINEHTALLIFAHQQARS